ncbi:MAG: hypothetical protein ACOY16_09735 [Chloroflexota bacterium]
MSKLTGRLALLTLVFTILWLVFLIADMVSAGPLETFEQVSTHAARLGWLYYATYFNATLVTLSMVAFTSMLSAWLRPKAPDLAVIGLVFVPIYGVLNLIVYISQVTLVPALFDLRANPQTRETADILLRLTLQSWPASAVAFFNGLAYAILGIPSILFGLLLWKYPGALRWGGLLLALNGAACIMGVIGFLTGSALLSQGVMIGGILFLLALIPISWAFLMGKK